MNFNTKGTSHNVIHQNRRMCVHRRNLLFMLIFLLITACGFPYLDYSKTNCGPSTLNIGEQKYEIESIQLKPDGTLNIPTNRPGTAFWVEGTDLQYIFMLSPTPENAAFLSALPEGTIARAAWSNCNSMTFSLAAPQPGSFGITYLPEQSTASILIFAQDEAAGNGYLVGGGLIEE